MTEVTQKPATGAALLAYTRERWDAFVGSTDQLSDEQWEAPVDPAGWSVKDHVAHVMLWDQSVIETVRAGVPPQQTLGVSDAAWTAGGYDAMNEEIRQRTIDHSVSAVKAERDMTFAGIEQILAGFTEEELSVPDARYGLNSGDDSLLEVLTGYLPRHYDEHRGYIEIIAGDTATEKS